MAKDMNDFWIIGVGASAGGLEALSLFIHALPEKPNAAFIIAQHLAPHAKSMMVELLGRQTKLPVTPVKDNLAIKKGEIYIVPPNFDLSLEEGFLRLTKAGVETRPKPSVNSFFHSLAKTYGRRAVGIILSGTGSDGSEGIRFIKEYGGVSIVQDSESAKYDGMPKSAFETGLVDAVLPPEKIAEQLFNILEKKEKNFPGQESYDAEDKVDFSVILKYLKQEIGADFSQYKISTIQRRIEKRLAKLEIDNLKDYYSFLKAHPEELPVLSQEMLVSVTSFFRDSDAYDVLNAQLEKMVEDKEDNEELRIWSAGCATGEEPYSIAFLINELQIKHNKELQIKIFATDLDNEALVHARNGMYSAADVAGMPAHFLTSYFDKGESHYEVKKAIREKIVFARQDLVQNPPFVKLDLVTCRNVLIYFETRLQNKIFEIFHYALRKGGLLFLGKSESPIPELFETIDKKAKFYRKSNVASQFVEPRSFKYTLNSGTLPNYKKKITAPPSVSELAMVQLLKTFKISGVVIDEESSIIHLVGDLTSFIGFPVGVADFRLSNLLPKSMAIEFSVLLRKAVKEKKVVKSRFYAQGKNTDKSFNFTIQHLNGLDEYTKVLLLVSFEEKVTEVIEVIPHGSLLHTEELPQRMLEMEQELTATKENLQTVIEELEISNEELQSLNEELSSTNEELQASNEELETTNEELQSTNEELTTLNEEVNIKSTELRMANASLENILEGITYPILVIDSDLKIQRYNPSANQIFNLSYSDLGTPITKASCQCEILSFEQTIRDVIGHGKMKELRCETSNRIYQIRIHPNLDDSKRIIGAIVVFFDNTAFIKAQDKLESSDKKIRAIIDGSPAFIYLKDSYGRYLMANKAYLDCFELDEDSIIGRTDREIFPEELANQFRDNDLEVVLKRTPSEKHENITFKNKQYVLLSNRFPLFGTDDRSPNAIGTVSIDVTKQEIAQKELQQSELRYRAIIEDQAVFVCRHDAKGNFSFTNTAFSNYFGGNSTINKDRTFLSIVDKNDQIRVQGELKKLSVDSPLIQYEHRFFNPTTSSIRWVRWIHRALFDLNHSIVEYQAVGFDVTEIHNKTAELLDKENLFTHVLEHTSDYLSVFRVDNDEFILESYNQSSGKIKSTGQNRMLGMKLHHLLENPGHEDETLKYYHDCVKDGVITNFEEQVSGPGGERFLATTLVPVMDNDQQVLRVVSISKDITKLKRTEIALRNEKQNAEIANSAKSDFLATMSHELRTPLNVIMGMSQFLMRNKTLKPEHVKLVDSIFRSSKVLLSLIEDVLDLSRIEAGKVRFEIKAFSLSLLIQDVIQAFETQSSQKGIKLHLKTNFDNDVLVLGDHVRLKQILNNLIGNAIKFTEKGSVSLEVKKNSIDDSKLLLQFSITDTGLGISQNDFAKIFKRFSQADSGTSRKFGGTGLGLAISKQLVELMDGTIGFESQEGQGSTFWFKITLPTAEKGHLVSISPEESISHLKNIKVLAVDDNLESLKVLQLMFEEAQGHLMVADGGEKAIEIVKNHSIDLILMDKQMPEIDGLETSRRIRSLPAPLNKIPIIALTANAMPEDRKNCLEAGMNDYLTKPVNFNDLLEIINRWSFLD